MAVRTSHGVPIPEHIALVAAELFYREGIHLVGVDRVAAEAEVTKRTLYRHFRSKDELVAAALRRSPRMSFPREGAPEERIAGAFRTMVEFVRNNAYRGCPYIIASAELADPRHPGRAVVRDFVLKRRAWFRNRAAEAGARDPDLLAEQLDVLFDGALASAAKRGDTAPAEAALIAAQTLLALACASAAVPARRAS